ncbi:hypothetical protein KPATCC21470_1068 [Kitasatospora purpeofusca]
MGAAHEAVREDCGRAVHHLGDRLCGGLRRDCRARMLGRVRGPGRIASAEVAARGAPIGPLVAALPNGGPAANEVPMYAETFAVTTCRSP